VTPHPPSQQFSFVHLPFDRGVFAASDWAIELRLIMATIDRRLVAETTLLDILLLAETGHLRSPPPPARGRGPPRFSGAR